MKSLVAATALLGLSLNGALADDRLEVVNTINAVGYHADQNDWDAVAAQFLPDGVVLDYTSYESAAAGTDAALPTLTPQEIVAAWQTVLPGYDRTHHLMGSHIVRIEGDKATALSNVYATHILTNDGSEDFWAFISDYEHELVRTAEGWKIALMRANMRAQLGNPKLPELAKQVVASRAKN